MTATTIGSVPFVDAAQALDLSARVTPDLPAWPQMPKRRPREDMVLQVVDGLPLLEAVESEAAVRVRPEGREVALTEFYEHFLAQDWDHFAIPSEAEEGLTAMLARAAADQSFGPDFLKAQLTGPFSFGEAVRTPEGKTLISDPELADTVVKGLGAKAAWLAGKIRALGRTPLIFIDEPGLTGFGSAFSTLSRETVVNALNEIVEIVKSAGDAYVGIHICGNSDWGVITSCGVDVINFDAAGYLDHFLLYPKEIQAFFDRGGYVAWGIVPTLNFTGDETAEELAGTLTTGWRALADKGVDHNLILERALITPACGMGSRTVDEALRIYDLLEQTVGRVAAA